VKISDIMTRDPIAVYDDGLRSEALNIMVTKKFRHLPVIFDTENYIGLLDIAKLVFDRLDGLESKVKAAQTMMTTLDLLERTGAVSAKQAQKIRKTHKTPDVNYVLDIANAQYAKGVEMPIVTGNFTVSKCAKVMKDAHVAGVIVVDGDLENPQLKGVITTKDMTRKVLHLKLDPKTTTVDAVMVRQTNSDSQSVVYRPHGTHCRRP
jgi:CBS domain-containing protein